MNFVAFMSLLKSNNFKLGLRWVAKYDIIVNNTLISNLFWTSLSEKQSVLVFVMHSFRIYTGYQDIINFTLSRNEKYYLHYYHVGP